MAKARMRDVVILLPGIMGSVLQRHGEDAWAISGQAITRALASLGGSMQALALDADDPDVDDLGDGVLATRILPDAHLVPGFVRIDGYSRIRQMMLDRFDVVAGRFSEATPGDVRLRQPGTFFEFPYDWRRDNRVSARRLKRLADQALAERRKTVRDARLILLGHSMGGLVSRYYLECLGGWRDCRALVTFGTPHRGAVQAIDYLSNGFRKVVEIGFVSEMARSFTSIYQLLPVYKALKAEGEWRRVAETDGVPHIDRERAAEALRFHREIEHAVSEREATPEGARAYTFIPFVGTAQPTLLSAEWSGGRVTALRDSPTWIDPDLGEGDGTVPRVSAIPIEMTEALETYLAVRHGSIQQHPQVLDDLRHRLARMQAPGLGAIRAPAPLVRPGRADLTLDVADLFMRDEPVVVGAQVRGGEDRVPIQEIVAEIAPADGSGAPVTHTLTETGYTWQVAVKGLEPGLYRVQVRARRGGTRAPLPVQELFEVAE